MHPRPPLVPSGIKGFITRDPCPTWVMLVGARRCCCGVALNGHFVPSIPVTSPAACPMCLHPTVPCIPHHPAPHVPVPHAACITQHPAPHVPAPHPACIPHHPASNAALCSMLPCTPHYCTALHPTCLQPALPAPTPLCMPCACIPGCPAPHVSALHAVLHPAPLTALHPIHFDPRCLRNAGLEPVISLGGRGRCQWPVAGK